MLKELGARVGLRRRSEWIQSSSTNTELSTKPIDSPGARMEQQPQVSKPLSFDEALAIVSDPGHPQHDELKRSAADIANRKIGWGPYEVPGHTIDVITDTQLTTERR